MNLLPQLHENNRHTGVLTDGHVDIFRLFKIRDQVL